MSSLSQKTPRPQQMSDPPRMSEPRTITMAPLDLRADIGAVHEDTRTVDLVFTTGADVVRYDWATGRKYLERLSLDPKHVRMNRLNAGAPLLNAHSAWALADQIGVVEAGTAVLAGQEGRATVRFSKRADVEPIYQDVRDKIIRNVSVGYRVHKVEETEAGKNGLPVRTAIDWEPYEISMVPIGADSGARVRSSKDVETNPCEVVQRATEEADMAEEKKPTETKPEVPPAEPTPPLAAEAIRAAAVQAERDRITGIQHVVRVAKLEPAVADDMVTRGITLDQARAEVLDKMAVADEQKPTDQRVRIEGGEDARDRFLRGATNWLLVKGGSAGLVAQAEKRQAGEFDPGEFRGMTLLDLARHCLAAAGVKTRGMDKMKIVSAAFLTKRDITQSTSDFATLLENTMHKVLQAAYATTQDTWSKWCGRGTVSDFRAHNRYRMGSFGALDAVAENGEFKNKAISDAEKGTITATTKGNIINVSRQMIVNDDMGAFTRLLTMLGRAAALSVEVDAYASLAENAGLGPTVGSVPMFDATHNNLGAGAALSAAALDANAVIMASQTDPWGNEYLDLRPAVLLVPLSLRGQALIINQSQFDPDTVANKSQMKPNVVNGMFRDIVGTPRLTGTRRYLFADPAIAPVFEVAFLEGQESPVLETQDGWRTDGAEMKVRFDYGVAGIDYRGAVTDAGA